MVVAAAVVGVAVVDTLAVVGTATVAVFDPPHAARRTSAAIDRELHRCFTNTESATGNCSRDRASGFTTLTNTGGDANAAVCRSCNHETGAV